MVLTPPQPPISIIIRFRSHFLRFLSRACCTQDLLSSHTPTQSHRCQIRVHRSNDSWHRDMDIARSSFDTLRRPLAAPRRLPGFPSFQLARFALSCLLAQTACRRGSTVEQLICNQWVAGSIPVAGSTETAGRRLNLRPAFVFEISKDAKYKAGYHTAFSIMP